MDFITLFVIEAAYILIGIGVAKFWYQRRHGVPIKIINGGWNAVFSSAFPMSFIWPLILLMPSLRNPELCRHPHHIMQRDEMRAEYDRYRAAAERDEQFRRAH